MKKSRRVLIASLSLLIVSTGSYCFYRCLSTDSEPEENVPAEEHFYDEPIVPPDSTDTVTPTPQPPIDTPVNVPEKVDAEAPVVLEMTPDAIWAKELPGLSESPVWKALMALPPEMVYKAFVMSVEQMSNGSRPLALAAVPSFQKWAPFTAVRRGARFVESPSAQNRFVAPADVLMAISTEQAVSLYQRLLPEFDRILHREMGYPEEETFDGMFRQALKHVASVKVPTEPPPLTAMGHIYYYEDSVLEAQSELGKALCRMKPETAAALVQWAQEMLTALQK